MKNIPSDYSVSSTYMTCIHSAYDTCNHFAVIHLIFLSYSEIYIVIPEGKLHVHFMCSFPESAHDWEVINCVNEQMCFLELIIKQIKLSVIP